MMGLLIKDLLCLRRQVKVYVIATVVYGGMTLMGVWDVSFFTWFFTLIAAMIPLSLFALDAAAKWDTYALTLPVERNGVVAARYLFTLLVVCVGLVLSLAMGGLTMALGRMEDWGGFLMAASVAAGAGLLLNAVMLPVLYKVGPEKARIAMLAIMGGFVLVVFLAIRGMEQAGQSGLLAAAAERIAALPALALRWRGCSSWRRCPCCPTPFPALFLKNRSHDRTGRAQALPVLLLNKRSLWPLRAKRKPPSGET